MKSNWKSGLLKCITSVREMYNICQGELLGSVNIATKSTMGSSTSLSSIWTECQMQKASETCALFLSLGSNVKGDRGSVLVTLVPKRTFGQLSLPFFFLQQATTVSHCYTTFTRTAALPSVASVHFAPRSHCKTMERSSALFMRFVECIPEPSVIENGS